MDTIVIAALIAPLAIVGALAILGCIALALPAISADGRDGTNG